MIGLTLSHQCSSSRSCRSEIPRRSVCLWWPSVIRTCWISGHPEARVLLGISSSRSGQVLCWTESHSESWCRWTSGRWWKGGWPWRSLQHDLFSCRRAKRSLWTALPELLSPLWLSFWKLGVFGVSILRCFCLNSIFSSGRERYRSLISRLSWFQKTGALKTRCSIQRQGQGFERTPCQRSYPRLRRTHLRIALWRVACFFEEFMLMIMVLVLYHLTQTSLWAGQKSATFIFCAFCRLSKRKFG